MPRGEKTSHTKKHSSAPSLIQTVQPLAASLSVPGSHRIGRICKNTVRGLKLLLITAGGESHPAPKNPSIIILKRAYSITGIFLCKEPFPLQSHRVGGPDAHIAFAADARDTAAVGILPALELIREI